MEEPRIRHTLGLSVGPPSDTTGLVVVETTDREDLPGKPHPFLPAMAPGMLHAVRHIQRFPPGTGYHDIVAAVGKVLELLDAPEVVAEVTGVGQPVAELFTWPKAWTKCIVLTAGENDQRKRLKRLPRLDVAATAQLVLQEGRLGIAPGPLADDLARDLRTFSPRPSAGAASELAWRDRPSDDLVYALAVALVEAERGPGYVRAIPILRRPRAVV
ncbi:MAG: hypothetical protein KBB14_05490 [Thermoanaerobaculia bacterium]|nr:hypothetical protein [Thermoanaerobaculia bacterium]